MKIGITSRLATFTEINARFSLLIHTAIAVLSVYFLTRLGLLIWSWSSANPGIIELLYVFAGGIIYDLAYLSYALIPAAIYLLIVPDKVWRNVWHKGFVYFLIFVNFFGIWFVMFAEILFWNEFKVRFNFISVDYLVYRREVTNNIIESYPMLPIFSSIGALALASSWLLIKRYSSEWFVESKFSRRLSVFVGWIVLPFVSYFVVGQELRQLTSNTFVNELASNGPYQFFAAFRNNQLDYYQFYLTEDNEKVSENIKEHLQTGNAQYENSQLMSVIRDVDNPGEFKQMNVIMITVESLSDEYIGYFGDQKNLTPNLNNLTEKSMFFDHFYATGTRTTRGLEAVTLSVPPTPGRSIVKRIGREKNLWSLGNVIREKGYAVKYIYGGRGYFDNMNAFFSGNGYDIIDQSSVADEDIGFENAWGMADEYLYNQAIKEADRLQSEGKPFFFHIMTTSNHRPYTYPDNRIDIPSGSGRDGAVKYTDWAIGEMLDKVKSKQWFDNTIFVILADHQAGVAGKTALPVDRYRIPMWIYNPKNITPQIIDKVSSQIDVPPTILALLNMDYRSAFYGKNILTMRKEDERALIGNYQHLGYYENGTLAYLSPQKKAHIKKNAMSKDAIVNEVDAKDPLIQKAIDYYQSASYIFSHQLDKWPSDSDKTSNETRK